MTEDEYMDNWVRPWWTRRCTHEGHYYYVSYSGQEQGCFRVLKEAEQVVVIDFVCLHQVHLCIDIDGIGGNCKTLSYDMYKSMTDERLLWEVQDMSQQLRSIAGM